MKKREKDTARILFVEQNKTAKEIAVLLKVTEKTVGNWIEKSNWKASKNAKALSKEHRLENIYQIIDEMASDRLRLNGQIADWANDPEKKKEITDLRNEIARIDNGVSQWNKTLANLSKDNNINQLIFIQIMEIVFRHFDARFPEMMLKSMEFQEYMINEIIPQYATI